MVFPLLHNHFYPSKVVIHNTAAQPQVKCLIIQKKGVVVYVAFGAGNVTGHAKFFSIIIARTRNSHSQKLLRESPLIIPIF